MSPSISCWWTAISNVPVTRRIVLWYVFNDGTNDRSMDKVTDVSDVVFSGRVHGHTLLEGNGCEE
jgi:hypothetical protein